MDNQNIKETLDNTLEYLEGIDETRNTKILTTNETNILLDYITNLQDRIKELETINEEHRRINGELREENEKSKNGVSLEKASDKTMILTQKFVIEQLKTRINKAIEYIKNDMPYLEEPDDDYENNHKMVEYDNSILLNILQGSDE